MLRNKLIALSLAEEVSHLRQQVAAQQETLLQVLRQLRESQSGGRLTIQTLSIDVPGKTQRRIAPCPNSCHFCVSQLHDSPYANLIGDTRLEDRSMRNFHVAEYAARMAFARDNESNTMIFTGTGEPIINPEFLESVADWNRQLSAPFRSVELQTSGATLTPEQLQWLRRVIRVTTVSLSLSSIWDNQQNADYNQTTLGKEVDIPGISRAITGQNLNLRLSLNMTDFYNDKTPDQIFRRARELGAHQLTFRVLYEAAEVRTTDEATVNAWIQAHRAGEHVMQGVSAYVREHGRPLERLPFGPMRYSLGGISTVIDDDCMSEAVKPTLKYLILRPNCKLYTKWDDPGSLLF